ncbi:MAG: SPOR domain-containing protein, partial [Pseudolabrys sp.]
LSLSPDSPSARTAARPLAAPAAPAASRTATVAAPAQMAPAAPAASSNAGGPGSYVQVSSQRSEAEAQAAFRSLQAKYPDQLGGRQPLIHKVDLGAKGTYYRAMVGPFTNASEAGELCSNLKAAGGQCLIQRN